MKFLIYLVFQLLIAEIYCQQLDYLHTQIGELVEVDISKYFNMIREELVVDSQTKSEYQLDQPLIIIQENQNGNWPAVLQQDQRRISDNTIQRVEILFHNQKSYKLRLLEFVEKDGIVQKEQIASQTFSGNYLETGALSLYQENKGVFCYQENGKNLIGHFTVNQKRQIQFKYYQSKLETKILFIGSEGPNYEESLSSPEQQQISIQILIYSPQDLSVSLIQLLPTNQIQVIQQIQLPCKSKFFTYIPSDLASIILCKDENDYFTVQILGLAIENNEIKIYKSNSLHLSLDTLFDKKIFNGRLFLVNLMKNSTKKFYVTEISIDKSNGIISAISKRVAIQNSLYMTFNFNLQNENFLSIVTDSYIMGVCLIQQQVIYQHRTFSTPEYQLITVFSIFKNTFFLYNHLLVPSSEILITQILLQKPMLHFRQTRAGSQIYKIELRQSFKNDYVIIKSIPFSNQLPAQQMPVSLTQSSTIIHHSVTQGSCSLKVNIEKYIIGSNLQIQANQFLSQPSIIMSGKFKSIDLTNTTFSNFKEMADISKIHSTSQQFILVEQIKQDHKLSLSILLVEAVDDKQTHIINVYELEMTTIIQKVDKNGVLLTKYQSNESTEFSLTIVELTQDNKVHLHTIQIDCLPEENDIIFDSNVQAQKIFFICNNKIKQISYNLTKKFNYLITEMTQELSQFAPFQQIQVFSGSLIINNDKCIIIYDYITRIIIKTIELKFSLKQQTLKVFLFLEQFLVAMVDDEQSLSLTLYNYKQSPQDLNLNQLRRLQGYNHLNFTLQDIIPIYLQQGGEMQEFLIINGFNQQLRKHQIYIYRIGQFKAQNQLYKIIETSSNNNFHIQSLFFTSNSLGFIEGDNLRTYSVKFQYELWITYQIDKTTSFSDRIHQEVNTQVSVLDQNLQFELTIQLEKDVSAANAIYEEGNQAIETIRNFFNQKLQYLSSYIPIDFGNSVKSNVLGWQVNQQIENQHLTSSVRQRLEQIEATDGEIFDSIKLTDNLFAYSSPNLITVGNQKIQISEFKYCYLYLDDSTVKVLKNGSDTISSLRFYSFCWGEFKNNQQFLIFEFKGLYNSQTKKQQIDVNLSNSYTKMYTAYEQQFVVSKIQSNEQLGIFTLIKPSYGADMPHLCVIKVDNLQKSFQFDCSSLSHINSLGILDVIWIDSISSSLYLSTNGAVYSGISKSESNVYKADLRKVFNFNLYNKYYKKNIVIAGQGNRNSFYISYDSNDVYEIEVIKGKINHTPFDLLLSSKFYGENDLAFTGYGLQFSSSYTILAAKNLTSETYIFLLYSSYSDNSREKIIKSSLQLNVQISSVYNYCVKLLQRGDKIMYILNTHPFKLSTNALLDIHKEIKIDFKFLQRIQNSQGVSFSLSLKNTNQNYQNSLPLKIHIKESLPTVTSFAEIIMIYSFIIVLILL